MLLSKQKDMKSRLLVFFLSVSMLAFAQPRSEQTLSEWQFSKDGISWEQVSVPHDWAIGGPFDKKWDLQTVAIVQNGETAATEKSGRSGALPWIGEGQYRTTFRVPSAYERAELVFDGAMSEPVVYVNGKEAVESMLMDGLPVLFHVLSRAAVGSIAFNNGSVYLFHQVADECRLQIVVVASFSCRYLHGNMSCRLHAQRMENLHQ